ncbi:MAG: LysR family transcriptional regulator, partial [Mesorhizobium sp.]
EMVELGPKAGMPDIGTYNLAMVVAPDASAPVKAVADHIRATFELFRETGKF